MRTNHTEDQQKLISFGRARAAVLFDEEPKVISAHADYRREDYVFQRTQSITMRALEWETRLKPMRHWAPNFVANLAFEIFA